MSLRRRKHWGWGWEDQQPDRAGLEAAAEGIRDRLGFEVERIEEPVPLDRVELRAPRVKAPASLAEVLSDEKHDRVSHALGKAYRDVVRGFRGEFESPPDLVARPRDEAEVEAVLGWCAEQGLAAIPYGGGTSVVGGVEPRLGDGYPGAVSVDLRRLDRVLEVDEVSGAARIQAGALGPALEDQLRERGLTLRHFPQSFEYSTLGGWIATRAGGHFATLYTHIDDLVESVRAITPAGEWESRRLPGSGAGPSPDRMLIGSEGILGAITEAWVRVRPRPTAKLSCGVSFASFEAGAEAVRELAQSGLDPSNCRLLDPLEALTSGAAAGDRAVLVLGFESARVPVDEPMRQAIEIARGHGGEPGEATGRGAPQSGPGAARRNPPPGRHASRGAERSAENGSASGDGGSDAVGAWRHAFLAAPYLRDAFVACGVLSDTFETAITWERFPDFHAQVIEAAQRAVAEAIGEPRGPAGAATGPSAPGSGGARSGGNASAPRVSCRFTHVYPDGPAPYYTILAPARRGDEVAQWDEIKAAVSAVVIDAGGTITHHHAVGRDHRPWYDRQRPDRFADALRGAKQAVDPAGILNPGVLIDP